MTELKKFKTKKYELFRNSENKIFTHAVIIENQGYSAIFCSSFELAQKKATEWRNRNLKGWNPAKVVEIVEVEQV
jgi:hypothetical protein